MSVTVFAAGVAVEMRDGEPAAPPSLAPAAGTVIVYRGAAEVEVRTAHLRAARKKRYLSNTGPKATCVFPDMGENGTYQRRDPCVDLDVMLAFAWQFGAGEAPAVLPLLRQVIDLGVDDDGVDLGELYSDWQLPPAGSKRYTFPAPTLPDGHYVAWVEAQGLAITPYAVPFVVNSTNAPLPLAKQRPWCAINRFDHTYAAARNVIAQVQYVPDAAPTVKPFKQREFQSFGGVHQPKNKRWARHLSTNVGARMLRRFAATPKGDVVIDDSNKYFHGDAIIPPSGVPRVTPVTPSYDGPIGRNALGHVSHIVLREGRKGAYMAETGDRLLLQKEDGTLITEVGLRIKPGRLHVHPGVLSSTYVHYHNAARRAASIQAYHDAFERVEDWVSQSVPGEHRTIESWGFATAMRRLDGSITYRDGHEFWIANTGLHCIDFADHWTAHSQAGFQPAHFPPPGYIQAPGPTGRTTMAAFIGVRGTPTEYCNGPWLPRFRKQDGRLYWNNMENGSFWSCDIHGQDLQPLIQSTLQPTWAQLGASYRLDQPMYPTYWRDAQGRQILGEDGKPILTNREYQPIGLRETWCVDGLGLGEASCIRPMGWDFDSQGDIIWCEHYTYALRKYTFADGRVTTLPTALMDVNGGSDSSGNREPTLFIDSDGSLGEVDDIFARAWANLSDKRFTKDAGAKRENWLFTSGKVLTGGPGHQADCPNYAWGIDGFEGRARCIGNAAGFQDIEISLRQASDGPDVDESKYKRGRVAWSNAGFALLLLGPEGQGVLGLPNAMDMAAMNDAELQAFLAEYGVDQPDLADAAYYIRCESINNVV
jgi:hypothetical protein